MMSTNLAMVATAATVGAIMVAVDGRMVGVAVVITLVAAVVAVGVAVGVALEQAITLLRERRAKSAERSNNKLGEK